MVLVNLEKISAFLKIHLCICILGSIYAYISTKEWKPIVAFAIGGTVVLVSTIVLALVLKGIFIKKSVAGPLLLIISKYAVLGGIIYLIARYEWLPIGWFAGGVGSVVITALTLAAIVLLEGFKNKNEL